MLHHEYQLSLHLVCPQLVHAIDFELSSSHEATWRYLRRWRFPSSIQDLVDLSTFFTLLYLLLGALSKLWTHLRASYLPNAILGTIIYGLFQLGHGCYNHTMYSGQNWCYQERAEKTWLTAWWVGTLDHVSVWFKQLCRTLRPTKRYWSNIWSFWCVIFGWGGRSCFAKSRPAKVQKWQGVFQICPNTSLVEFPNCVIHWLLLLLYCNPLIISWCPIL